MLGVPVFASKNYWRNSPEPDDYLLRHDPGVAPDDCTVVVVDNTYFHYCHGLPAALFRKGRSYRTVYFDLDDGYPSRAFGDEFRQFDVILRAHYSDRLAQPRNFKPWVIGPTNRILKATEGAGSPGSRRPAVLVSYRVGHPVRTLSNQRFLERLGPDLPIHRYQDQFEPNLSDPYDQLHWHQTGRRHNPAFYSSLAESLACACFGGSLRFAALSSPLGIWQRASRRMGRQSYPYILTQWDSFRLWESWAAGCATFHLDLAQYGAVLPVMPRNWEHYIGIDLNRPDAAIDRLRAEPGCLERIAINGRIWALEHYSPLALATRFLQTMLPASQGNVAPG